MESDVSLDRPSLSTLVADALIELEMRDLPCSRVTRVLGSMLVFDFGSTHCVKTRRGATVQVGSAELSIRNCFWALNTPGIGRITSDSLDEGKMEQLQRVFLGRVLTGCRRRNGRFYLEFQHGTTLGIDLTNRYEAEPDEEIAEVRTALNHSISLSASGFLNLGIADTSQPNRAAA